MIVSKYKKFNERGGEMKQIAVIGVGGVGGYFGGKLTTLLNHHNDLKIYFIARGKHLEEIQKKGLCLKAQEEEPCYCKPTMATDCIEDLPLIDVCLIAVKAYDLQAVLERLKGKIHEETIIIPLLNGVDIPQRIRKVISKGIVYPTCVYVGTHIESPGVVAQKGGSCTIIIGKDPQHSEKKPDEFMGLMDEAGIHYEWQEQCALSIWSKYMFIAAYGMVTASTHRTLGEVYKNGVLRQMTLEAIGEIAVVGRIEGIPITDEMIINALEKADTFPYETKTSFQRDYERGGRDERVIFGETMIELAKKHQVPIPVLTRLYAQIQTQPLSE